MSYIDEEIKAAIIDNTFSPEDIEKMQVENKYSYVIWLLHKKQIFFENEKRILYNRENK
jgi:hypothetical protein